MAKILVVDDEPGIVMVVGAVLEAAGHEVVATSDPTEAVALAGTGHVAAVVLDIMMPSLSGFEVLHRLRADPGTRDIPALFLSGCDKGTDRVRGLREGADDYLTKPFEPEELVLRMGKLLDSAARTQALQNDLQPVNDADPLNKGRRLGRYHVFEVVGSGASGTVFRGWDPRLKREIALKAVRIEAEHQLDRQPELAGRLLAEAVTAARFSHQNIVAVYDVCEGNQTPYIIMEYVAGTSLAAYVEAIGKLATDQVIPLALAISRGLAAAHSRRVLHSDVKLGNVLLGHDGSIKLSDFGLSLVMTSMSLTPGQVFGTMGFMAPEVLTHGEQSSASDLFGLGAILYRCLTGSPAFAGNTLGEVMRSTLDGGVEPVRKLVPETPVPLAQLTMMLLDMDPRSRPGSATDVVASLEAMAQKIGSPWQPDANSLEARASHEAGSSFIALPAG